ncbi:MAG: DUF1320 family protein [Crocinitomicaceae bacterium]|nr:DUF1320 family protein [Crocinitomicaceae bacterium]
MTILLDEDVLALIEQEVLNDITGGDSTYIDKAELSAIGEVTGYLNIRYDAVKCLDRNYIEADTAVPPAHTGYNGISTVLEKLADVMLYNLHTRLMPDNIPKLRQARYENAITWFEKVADGFIAPSLPIKSEDPTGPLRYGNSSTPQNPYY